MVSRITTRKMTCWMKVESRSRFNQYMYDCARFIPFSLLGAVSTRNLGQQVRTNMKDIKFSIRKPPKKLSGVPRDNIG